MLQLVLQERFALYTGSGPQFRGGFGLSFDRSSSDRDPVKFYVDGIVITGSDSAEITKLKFFLGQEFEIKDLGQLRYFLGIEVAHSSSDIFLSQRKYILDLLSETGMLGCRFVDTPLEANTHLKSEDGEPVDKGGYQRLVGRLIYLSHTRPDITHASAPGKGILFSPHNHMCIEAFIDADWTGSPDDRRSTSGYCSFVGGNLVTWRSKKQALVTRSSAETEFRAMAQGICELLWLKDLLQDLGISSNPPMTLYCDSKSAISIAHNPVQHDKTKHVEIDRHFIKELYVENVEDPNNETFLIDILDQLVDDMSKVANMDDNSIPCEASLESEGKIIPSYLRLKCRLLGWSLSSGRSRVEPY
ncbi:uncharacterized mitochondrial protein AtMg00810-like [Telopea speciosissima]|uniref:uncharacterized mitochondrial protein AtMg00810-like n=1 Tax=Telopea speciosissima TaxID=54955 RepID=UPI001CC6C131|nr:uncharacterized mitochondrial protein AtMg00810-like [Telopea speciosissima]